MQWFWEILGSFSNDERILFMRFVSGRSRLPVNTADLSQRFQILKIDRVNMANVVSSCNHTHTRLTALFPGRPRWAGTRKGKNQSGFYWQWHQQGYLQVCTSLQADNHASTAPLSFFTGQMPLLPPNQQCQSTEGNQITDYYRASTD